MRPKICPVVTERLKTKAFRSLAQNLALAFHKSTSKYGGSARPERGTFRGKKYSQINKSVSGALLLCQIVGVGRGQQRESIGYECSIPNSQHPASNTQYPILLWPNRCHGYSSNWSPVFSAQI